MIDRFLLRKLIVDLLLKTGPIFIIYASNTLTFNVKRIWVSQLGADFLEAHIIARTIAELLTLPVPLLMSQTPIKVAELFGVIKAKKEYSKNSSDNMINKENHLNLTNIDEANIQQQIGDIVRQAYLLSIVSSIPVIGVLIATKGLWISSFQSTEKISALAGQYLLAYSSVVTGDYINTMTEGILSAVNQEKWIILLRVLSSSVDIGLGALLIPKYALSGDAYSTLARNIVGVLVTLLLLKLYNPLSKYNILSFRWGNFHNMRLALADSWPYSLYQLAQSGVSYLLSIFMGRVGPGRLAAYQIPNALFNMAMSINTAISVASNRMIAQNFGSNNFRIMPQIGVLSIATNVSVYGTSALLINILQKPLASLFLNRDEFSAAATMLRYNFIILAVVNALQMLFDNAGQLLAATDDTLFASIAWLASAILFTLPLAAMVTYLLKFDIYGIGFAIGIGTFISTAATFSYWFKRSSSIIATDNNVRSSNIALTDMISRVGFFYCKNSKKNEFELKDNSEKRLLIAVDEENNSHVPE